MKLYVTLLIFASFGPTKVLCQNRAEIINGLNSIIKPITTVSPNDSFDDIDFLKEVAKGASVVGIGESTHGTPLYDMYRQRLVRFLVQEMGYKAIIDEGDIIAAEQVDAYINCKADTIALMGGLQPVVTNKKELDWLRAYNANKSENKRVHIYGAEVNGFHGIVQKVKDHFFPNEPNDTLKVFEGDTGMGYKNLTKEDFKDIQALSQRLKGECRSPAQRHTLSLLNQEIDFAYHQRFGRFNKDFEIRDKYMFKNIKSIISGAPQNKVIILAHNGHLQKTKFMRLTSLGYLLNNFYGHKYFVAATDFNIGNVYVYNLKMGHFDNNFFGKVKDKNAVEYYFAQCKYPNFFLSINEALNNPATASFVNKKHQMLRSMGSSGVSIKSSIRLSKNYDLIIFFNDTVIKN